MAEAGFSKVFCLLCDICVGEGFYLEEIDRFKSHMEQDHLYLFNTFVDVGAVETLPRFAKVVSENWMRNVGTVGFEEETKVESVKFETVARTDLVERQDKEDGDSGVFGRGQFRKKKRLLICRFPVNGSPCNSLFSMSDLRCKEVARHLFCQHRVRARDWRAGIIEKVRI